MSKNPQKSVDSISDIRFNAGMDARKMKKVIQYEALGQFKQRLMRSGDKREYVGQMLDRNLATDAMVSRFNKMLDQMIDDAFEKYPIEDIEFDFGG